MSKSLIPYAGKDASELAEWSRTGKALAPDRTLLDAILWYQRQAKLLSEIARILNKPIERIHAEINAWLARHVL